MQKSSQVRQIQKIFALGRTGANYFWPGSTSEKHFRTGVHSVKFLA